MCFLPFSDNIADLLTFVVIFNFAVEIDELTLLFANLHLDEPEDEVPARRQLFYEESDMEQSYSDSILGCCTLSDYEEADTLEDEVEQAEGEEETEEKRRPEREANEDERCHKRRMMLFKLNEKRAVVSRVESGLKLCP